MYARVTVYAYDPTIEDGTMDELAPTADIER